MRRIEVAGVGPRPISRCKLPLPIADRVRYPATLVDRVRDLAHGLPDAEIGNQLNREGHASPKR